MVIRDSRGEILGSGAVIVTRIASSFAAEASACLHALQLCLDLGFTQIEVEEDALSIKKKCQSNLKDKSEIGSYIRDIQHLRCRFQHLPFRFIPRNLNTIAHTIAQKRV